MGEIGDDFEESRRPHVAAIAFLTQGHINPLMHFCLKLAAHNVLVTFITIDTSSLEPIGGSSVVKQIPQIPPQFRSRVRLELLDLNAPTRVSSLLSPESLKIAFRAIANLQAPFQDLVQRLQPRVCCIISDCMFSWTQDVSRSLGIPRASFWTAAAASLAVDFFVPLLIDNGDIPVTDSNKDNLISYVPGLEPLQAWQLPFIYHSNNSMTTSDPGYRRKIERSIILKDDEWIIANSLEEFEPRAFRELRQTMNKNIIDAGPLLPQKFFSPADEQDSTNQVGVSSLWKQDMDCLKWLDSKPPKSVIYISFGSAVNLTVEEFEELSRGLQSSQCSFLWALRPKGVKDLPAEALERFKEESRSSGLVISWAPQVEVLSHRSTGVFVTHCGWNSVLEGICSGVVMLGWPKNAEQNLNCKLLEDLQIGCSLVEVGDHLESRNVGSDEIAARLKKVFGDSAMQEKAEKLQRSSKEAVENSQLKLEPFVNFLNNNC